MAKDKLPTVGTLDKPENLDELLKEDRGDDCAACRILGEFSTSTPPPLPLAKPSR